MKLNRQMAGSSLDPSLHEMIPLIRHQIGSWQVAISRRPLAPEELTSRYDAVSESWRRTARRFQLETAYRAALLACSVENVLAHVESDARVLDCGIGSGSLSLALHSIQPDHIDYCGIDMSGEMLATADVVMRQAGAVTAAQTGRHPLNPPCRSVLRFRHGCACP